MEDDDITHVYSRSLWRNSMEKMVLFRAKCRSLYRRKVIEDKKVLEGKLYI